MGRRYVIHQDNGSMTIEKLNKNKTTIAGYKVKDLYYKEVDNIITGFVKDPEFGNPNLHEGWSSVQWTTHGFPLGKNKGREELKLRIDLESPK